MDIAPEIFTPDSADDTDKQASGATEQVPEVILCPHCRSAQIKHIKHHGTHYWLCGTCEKWIDIPKFYAHQKRLEHDQPKSNSSTKGIIGALLFTVIITIIFALALRFWIAPYLGS